jgi:hypothetical protein
LHNNVWGQINPGGMYDLFWWATETIPAGLYPNFLTFRNFMDGIPLDNGHYRTPAIARSEPAPGDNATIRMAACTCGSRTGCTIGSG